MIIIQPYLFGAGGGPTPPGDEPAPDPALLAEYNSADETLHDWSNLTGFSHGGVQINSGRLYGISSANPSGAILPMTIGPTETVRLVCEIEIVGVNPSFVLAGFTTNTTVSAGFPGAITAGFQGGNINKYLGSGISTTGEFDPGFGGGTSGTYTVHAVATPDLISITVRNAANSLEGSVVLPRSAMPTISGIVFCNFDNRGLSGSYIKAFGVKKSLTPFRTKTVGGQTIEGNCGLVHWIGTSLDDCVRIQVPKGATGAALPIVLYTHAVTETESYLVADSRYRPVLTALENAGYIVASAKQGVGAGTTFTWGNQTAIDQLVDTLAHIRATQYASGAVHVGASGGAVVGHNIITRDEVYLRGVYSICGVLDLPQFWSDQPSHRTTMNAAYGGATDLASFTANSSGYQPTDDAAGAGGANYTGKRVRFSVGSTDTITPAATHADVMSAAVAAYADEYAVQTYTGGHVVAATINATDITDFVDRCFP